MSILRIILFTFIAQCSFAQPARNISYGSFGKITIYQPKQIPTSLVLFISGDGGWKNGVITMAQNFVKSGAMVAGIDAKQYAKAMALQNVSCNYPAGDFEQLSMMLQKKYNFKEYLKPIIVGYSFGATLAYALLTQSPTNTFKGAIALGFCPDIDLVRPLCKGSGLIYHVLKPGKSYYLDKVQKLNAPFIVLNGLKDETCPFNATERFLKGIENAKLVKLDKVGHGFSATNNWYPQLRQAFDEIQSSPLASSPDDQEAQGKNNIPITETLTTNKSNGSVILMISGDGGWTSFDQGLASEFARNGYMTIGLDAQKYFWNAKNPVSASKDLFGQVQRYMTDYKKSSFLLVGYSFGASILPFLGNRIPDQLSDKFKGLIALSPDEYTDFEIHVADMLGLSSSVTKYNVINEMKRNKFKPKICVFGEQEDPENTKLFRESGADIILIPGGHRYNENYEDIVSRVLKKLE